MSLSIYLAAVEDSGDALGADVISELRRMQPDVNLSGVGGEQMKALGVNSAIDTDGMAILGLLDGLKAFGKVKKLVSQIADEIASADPDAVVLIDSWGVMWRLARELKRRGICAKRIKLVGPQVWATRPGRARVLARWCDHLLCIHSFEEPFYEPLGLPTTVIGNPSLGRTRAGDGQSFRDRHGISVVAPTLGVLFGSRQSELKRVAPALAAATSMLVERNPDLTVISIGARSVSKETRELSAAWPFRNILVTEEHERNDAMSAMSVALACSGTVTTELAQQGVAVIAGYRLGWISWLIARLFLLRTKFITLINVAADREIIPEFVQTRLQANLLAPVAERLLKDSTLRDQQVRNQNAALELMTGENNEPAGRIAARAILSIAALESTQRA